MSKGKILLVEDEQVLRDVYKLILSTEGYDVATANNGKEAQETLGSFTPGLILLDIFMPIMDGKEFLETVDKKAISGSKVVVFSNTSDSGISGEMTQLGADKVVLKADLIPSDVINLVGTYFSG